MMLRVINLLNQETVWNDYTDAVPARGEEIIITHAEDGVRYDTPKRYLTERVVNYLAEELVEVFVVEIGE